MNDVARGLVVFLRRRWRWIALVVGAGALAALVADAGPRETWAALVSAGAMMPLIVACDVAFFTGEVLAHRTLLGEDARKVPWPELVRVALVTYTVLVLAPVGRAGAEVARTASLARWVGSGRAAGAGAHLQAASLLANTMISVPCAIASAALVGARHPLTWLVTINGLATGAMALAGLWVAGRSRIGRWLGAKLPRLARAGEELDQALRRGPGRLARATALCAGSRLAQTAQYAAILFGLHATLGVGSPFVAQAIHLVGAGLGDLVPNQVGVLEGAYRIFADAVGLEASPARAISIALLARSSQVIVVTACLTTLALWKRGPEVVAVGPRGVEGREP